VFLEWAGVKVSVELEFPEDEFVAKSLDQIESQTFEPTAKAEVKKRWLGFQ
jgi:hypothetical protein